MAINIPKNFDKAVVTGSSRLPYIGKGMVESNVRRAIFKFRLSKPKYVEPRNGGQMAAYELEVFETSHDNVHAVGQFVSVNFNLNDDYGPKDCKRFLAIVLGAIAAREPGYDEERDSAGKVIERKPRFAAAGDPNAITGADLVRTLEPDDDIFRMIVGTKLRCEAYLHPYTPDKGVNIGIEKTVVRYEWSLIEHTPEMAALQVEAKKAIEQDNAAFKATLQQAA